MAVEERREGMGEFRAGQKWIVETLKEFKQENKEAHKEIVEHLKELNGTVADHQATLHGGSETGTGLCAQFAEYIKLHKRNFWMIMFIFFILASVGILDWYDIISLVR